MRPTARLLSLAAALAVACSAASAPAANDTDVSSTDDIDSTTVEPGETDAPQYNGVAEDCWVIFVPACHEQVLVGGRWRRQAYHTLHALQFRPEATMADPATWLTWELPVMRGDSADTGVDPNTGAFYDGDVVSPPLTTPGRFAVLVLGLDDQGAPSQDFPPRLAPCRVNNVCGAPDPPFPGYHRTTMLTVTVVEPAPP